MALFLVQHGISAAKDIDPERGLTDQGRAETKRIAQVAQGYGIRVGKIVHSGKKRAAQTASIYHDALSLKTPLEVVPGLNPLDDVRGFAEGITAQADAMVVGHMPFMQRLLAYLVAGSAEMKIYQFQNSGIVCLDVDEQADGRGDWFIKWTLNPHIS
jgi:phosphohistidine phosphatase